MDLIMSFVTRKLNLFGFVVTCLGVGLSLSYQNFYQQNLHATEPQLMLASSFQGEVKVAAKNIYLLKIHKTGSTVLYNILSRYTIKRNLSWATFWTHPYNPKLHRRITGVKKAVMMNLIPPFFPNISSRYNVIATHSVYERKPIETVLATPVSYLTFLRHPVSHFRSFLIHYSLSKRKCKKPVTRILDQLSKRDMTSKRSIRLKDLYAAYFGFPVHINSTRDPEFIQRFQEIKSRFFIGFTEHFVKSLLLMKNRFHLEWEDIIFIKLRSKNYKNGYEDHEELLPRLCKLSPLDCYIYEELKKSFEDMVESAGSDLLDEEKEFNNMLNVIGKYCYTIYDRMALKTSESTVNSSIWTLNPLHIERNAWSRSFDVSPKTCALMKIKEKAFVNYFYLKQNWSKCKLLTKCPIKMVIKDMDCKRVCQSLQSDRNLIDSLLNEPLAYFKK